MSTSVVRALRMLDLLARSEKPMSLSRIAESLDIPKSTAHSILRDMVGEAFVDAVDGTAYRVGLRAFEVGAAHLRTTTAVTVVAPELAALTRELNITSHYAVLDGPDAVYLCKEDPPGLGIQLASSVGARLPSHLTAVGRASLAWLPDAALPDHVDLTRTGTRTEPVRLPQLKRQLEQVRQRGFANDDGEAAAGVHCVAAPIFDPSGCRGAVGVSYLRGAAVAEQQVADRIRTAADRVTALLGGRTVR